MSGFSCVHTYESLFTNRLYVARNFPANMKKYIFSDEKNGKVVERRGLGMTEYGSILGRILTICGFAFKTKDYFGKALYINKKSFCNLCVRSKLVKDSSKYVEDAAQKTAIHIHELYTEEKITTISALVKKELTRDFAYSELNDVLKNNATESICELLTEMMKHLEMFKK
jgi:hypothetical protein